MSRYDFIRFGGFVNWADEDTDTFRKMKVCLPVKEPVEDDTKIGLISTDEDNPEEIAVSYSVRQPNSSLGRTHSRKDTGKP